MMGSRLGRGIALVFVLLLAISGSAHAETIDVAIQGFAFNQQNITIQVGDEVRWTNNDGAPHTSTADDALWDSGTLNNGQQYSRVFTEVGVHTYKCTFHPSMTGSVTVQDSPVPAPSLGLFGYSALGLLLIGAAFFFYRRQTA